MGGNTAGLEASQATSECLLQAQSDHPDTAAALAAVIEELSGAPLALVILFVARCYDRAMIEALLPILLPDTPVIGCTTAGEVGRGGYLEDHIVAVGLPASNFSAAIGVINDLAAVDAERASQLTLRLRAELIAKAADWPTEIAFLLSDGLSLKEDSLVWNIGPALGRTPLIGGSAGDGLAFGETMIFADGRFRGNAAVLAILRTRCRVTAFRFDHLVPTETCMVVTGADPANRLVTEINAEPAAQEYARLLGRDPNQLTPFTFAAHPVVVCIRGQHHVRAIQRVEPNGDLRFFSVIDQGLVLRLAEGRPIAQHLEESLAALADPEPPSAILGCDCILRRLEAEESQAAGAVSASLSRHRVFGFNTYGEQFNMLHVNQTLTGFAFYKPADG